MIRIETFGLTRIASRIQSMRGTPGQFMPAPAMAGMFVLDLVAEIFTTGGRGQWTQSRMAQDTGRPTMQDTGALLAAMLSMGSTSRQSSYYTLHGKGEQHDARGIFRQAKDSIEVGVASAYGALQNAASYFSTRYKRQIDGRPFLYLRPQDRDLITSKWLVWSGRSFAATLP